MDIVHRECLQECHMFFLENIHVKNSCLIDQLYADKVLSAEDLENINIYPTNGLQIRKIVEKLPFKGKKAFSLFLKALSTSGHDHVVLELNKQEKNISIKIGSLSDSLKTWVPRNYITKQDEQIRIENIVRHVIEDHYPSLSETCIKGILENIVPGLMQGVTLSKQWDTIEFKSLKRINHSQVSQQEEEIINKEQAEQNIQLKEQIERAMNNHNGPNEQSILKEDVSTLTNIDSQNECSRSPKEESEKDLVDKEQKTNIQLSLNPPVSESAQDARTKMDTFGASNTGSSTSSIETSAQQTQSSDLNMDKMETWKIHDVCRWLSLIEDIDDDVIDLFRKEKIRGKALKWMTYDQLYDIFPTIAKGDLLEIIDERDKQLDQEERNTMRPAFELLAQSSNGTIMLEDLITPSTIGRFEEQDQPIQCTSNDNEHKFSLISKTNFENDIEENTALKVVENVSNNEVKADINAPTSDQNEILRQNESGENTESLETSHSKGLVLARPLDNNMNQESCNFKATADLSSKYQKGAVLSCRDSHIDIHKFIPMDQITTKREITMFVEETMTFISICLNGRKNGRIHFGVSAENFQVQGTKVSCPLPLCQEELSKALNTRLPPGDVNIPYSVKPIHFIEVTPSDETQHVLEIDVLLYNSDSDLDETHRLKIQEESENEKFVNGKNSHDSKEAKQKTRKFEEKVDWSVKYRKGTKMQYLETRPSNMIRPIHKFVDMENINTKRECAQFVREAVTFVSACLNERTNGTIYFGVSSEKNDEIVGVKVHDDLSKYDEELRKGLHKCFFPEQVDIVFHCVRPIKFIEVTSIPKSDEMVYVFEIDVVPSGSLCADDAFFTKVPIFEKKKLHFEDAAVYRIYDGTIKKLNSDDLHTFLMSKDKIALQRKEKEKSEEIAKMEAACGTPDLRQQLLDVLCKGENSMPVDVYPLLVMNKPADHLDEKFKAENLSFLSTVKWKATFDYDANAEMADFFENIEGQQIKICSSITDFHKKSTENLRNPDRYQAFLDDICNSKVQTWTFVNGYNRTDVTKMNLLDWKRQRRESFKEAIRFFSEEIPEGRAIVVFLLLSDDLDIFMEGSEEFISAFKENWICLCDSKEIAEKWMEELLRRQCTDETILKQNTISMPWKYINAIFKEIQDVRLSGICKLITASGARIPLNEKTKHELCDLDILSVDECENYNLQESQKVAEFIRSKEMEYYKGGPVSWWNFWLEGQVLHRTKLNDLKSHIRKALNGIIGDDEQFVGRVTLYHQAGAGGTTTAMNALWDLKSQYRCAIVEKISEPSATAKQILRLRNYEETGDPKPVIILLDNQEEEKSNLLLAELEERAKQMWRDNSSNHTTKVICVLLYCMRRSQMPSKESGKRVLLKHELDQKELAWFHKKSKDLEANYDKDKLSISPKLLISFNIMKANFDKNFIKKMVNEIIRSITSTKELTLLKYVALLNAYDLQSQPLPTAAFDMIMEDLPWKPGPKIRWEAQLSLEFHTLMNETSKPSMGMIHALRITSPLLSKEILLTIKKLESNNETVSAMMLQFLNKSDIWQSNSIARNDLLKIVKDVAKFRGRSPNGLPETKFAPLIQEIVDKESVDKAAEVLEKVLDLSEDPFIAQNLSRLYIYAQNWEKAKQFSNYATEKKPDNSFLWDTYGRVYLQQLVEYYKDYIALDRMISVEDSKQFIEIGLKGIDIFRKVQAISDTLSHSQTYNSAGYFGELEIVKWMLASFSYVEAFPNKDTIRRFLSDPKYIPNELKVLYDVDGKDFLSPLKEIAEHSQNSVKKLKDEFIQLREDNLDEYKRNMIKMNQMKLEELKRHLEPYYGEDSDMLPEGLSQEDQCAYRRRRIFRLGGNTMGSIFELKYLDNGEQTLKRISKIVNENLKTQFYNAEDLQTAMCVNLALLQIDSTKYLYTIRFNDMVHMSQRLYELRKSRSFIHLEPYLFFTMFNWPRTLNTSSGSPTEIKMITPRMLTDALYQWKSAYYEKYPRQKDEGRPNRKKDTTIFFFGNGSDMNSITNYEALKAPYQAQQAKGETFWKMPLVLRELQRFSGNLCTDGEDVELTITYGNGNKDKLKIQTSFPIRTRTWWNKKVYFVIGFSWRGPKAFDVSLNDPTQDLDFMAADHTIDLDAMYIRRDMRPYVYQRDPDIESHERFYSKLAEYNLELKKISYLMQRQAAGETLKPHEKKKLQREEEIRKRRTQLIMNRQKMITSQYTVLDEFYM